jgi:hypothetical protein
MPSDLLDGLDRHAQRIGQLEDDESTPSPYNTRDAALTAAV